MNILPLIVILYFLNKKERSLSLENVAKWIETYKLVSEIDFNELLSGKMENSLDALLKLAPLFESGFFNGEQKAKREEREEKIKPDSEEDLPDFLQPISPFASKKISEKLHDYFSN